MIIEPQVDRLPEPHVGWSYWRLDSVRETIGDAYNLATRMSSAPRDTPRLLAQVGSRLDDARITLEAMRGHDGPEDAAAAVRFVEPRVDRAREMLVAMGAQPNPTDIQVLLTEFGDALDHIEQVLGGIGWG